MKRDRLKGKYAQDSPYWGTDVNPYKSQGEITALLDDFGAQAIQISQGRAGDKVAWLIRFTWRDHSYRFVFTPLPLRGPKPGYKPHTVNQLQELKTKALSQMGRIAVFFIKSLLTAADAQPAALFGFMEIPDLGQRPDGLPYTAGEIDTAKITNALPPPSISVAPDGEILVEG